MEPPTGPKGILARAFSVPPKIAFRSGWRNQPGLKGWPLVPVGATNRAERPFGPGWCHQPDRKVRTFKSAPASSSPPTASHFAKDQRARNRPDAVRLPKSTAGLHAPAAAGLHTSPASTPPPACTARAPPSSPLPPCPPPPTPPSPLPSPRRLLYRALRRRRLLYRARATAAPSDVAVLSSTTMPARYTRGILVLGI